MDSRPLYPEIEPYSAGMLPVDNRHSLYWERSGNPKGVAALFLHGGPGGGSRPANRRYCDPGFFDIVLFDQRGCGRSVPNGELANNDTQHLIADIEALRQHLGIERWLVTGGSWGSFLSLAYAEAHPERCLGLRLHGVFLGSREEVDWWYYGIRNTFPERWKAFVEFLPESERGDLLQAFHRRVTNPDPAVHLPAAIALRTYSGWTQTFREDPNHVAKLLEPQACLPLARFFTHFGVNGFFMPEGELLRRIERIRRLPGVIVQGRYDVVTRMRIAFELKQAWPEVELKVVTEASHSGTEQPMAEALTGATERLKARLKANGLAPRSG